jgi:putative transposase
MSKSIPNVDWANQLESVIRQFVKEKLELIMREEIKNFPRNRTGRNIE